MEAVIQSKCLMDYMEAHVDNSTTILFARKGEAPGTSFVTMEIKDNVIKQVFGRFNKLPDKDVFEFLEYYAKVKWFYFDPYRLIMDHYNDIDEDEWDSNLLCYAEAYHKQTQFQLFSWPDDGIDYIHRTLWDLFPGVI